MVSKVRFGSLLLAGVLAVGVAAPSNLGAAPAQADPTPAPAPAAPQARIVGAQWQGDHQVDLTVFSPAMNTNVTVQLLLARDWHADPKARFPTLYLLDGMRARDDRNGWLIETDAAAFYRDKNVTVVLPVGGQSSWYTDWRRPDNGKNYKWETFLAKELPPLLKAQWRATDARGVAGVSMGGTAAFTLAARNRGLYRFAGSYSGILSTSSAGMPEAIGIAMRDAGGFNADAMYGPPTDPAWAQHDPLVLAEKLRGVSLYFSSGNGSGPAGQPNTDVQAMSLELLSRSSNQAFAVELNRLGIPANALYRPSGTHSWAYWQFENGQAWPQVQAALAIPDAKPCAVAGAIGALAPKTTGLGPCVTVEYGVPGGRAQDFRGGQIFWSNDTGAQVVGGAIGGAYLGAGGPGGPLGYPTSAEQALPGGKGRFQTFQHGTVYWTPQDGAHAVRGGIGDKYAAVSFERSRLGLPVADEAPLKGGAYQRFQGGQVYWSNGTAAIVDNGPIFTEWGKQGYEGGRLGYPVADATPIPGGFEQRFQHGVIALVNGATTVR